MNRTDLVRRLFADGYTLSCAHGMTGITSIYLHIKKNLEEEIENGNFRADLFYRLNVVPIQVPSLLERIEDLPLLVQDFLNDFKQKGLGTKEFSTKALQAMKQHSWPGNIRELRNVVERLVIMSPEAVINENDVALFLGTGSKPVVPESPSAKLYPALGYKEAKKQFEHDYLKAQLEANDGNVSQTAEQIGMERSHLHKKVKSLGIELSE